MLCNQFKLCATLPAVPAISILFPILSMQTFKFSSAGISSSIIRTLRLARFTRGSLTVKYSLFLYTIMFLPVKSLYRLSRFFKPVLVVAGIYVLWYHPCFLWLHRDTVTLIISGFVQLNSCYAL